MLDHDTTDILIKNATIIDGTGKNPYAASMLIKDKRIVKITRGNLEAKADRVIDATGNYILPGMIDCHVHVMINDYNLMSHVTTPFSLNFFKAVDNLKTLLYAGITSARDAGGADLGVKQALQQGILQGPDLKISISPLSITGGHLDAWMLSGMQLYLLNPPYPGNPCGICDGETEVRKKVREVLRSGADIIKMCSTGGVMSPTDHPEFTQFTIAEIQAMVEEGAMRNNIKVMAHAQGLEGIKNAIRAGVHSIEHGIYLDDEAIDLMLEKEVFLVPTLLAVHSILQGDYPQAVKDQARAVEEVHKKSIEKAHKAGVKIAMGTDSGIMAHGRNLEELSLMCEVGMSPMQAITASTKTAAECLEIDKDTGTIEEGKIADFLMVHTNPLDHIISLTEDNNMVMICKEGKIIKHNTEQI